VRVATLVRDFYDEFRHGSVLSVAFLSAPCAARNRPRLV